MQVTITRQHHLVTLHYNNDKLEQTRGFLLECAQKISLKKNGNEPMSWCASYGVAKNVFSAEAMFQNQDAVKFHQGIIASIVKSFGTFIAATPETIVRNIYFPLPNLAFK